MLAADGWEHAYYVDYRNDKAKWVDAFTHMTDWAAAGKRFDAVAGVPSAIRGHSRARTARIRSLQVFVIAPVSAPCTSLAYLPSTPVV